MMNLLKNIDKPNFETYSIILVNLIPLFGALFLGWSTYEILMSYIVENLVIGFYNVAKMLLCRNGLGYSLFFIIHYGMFNFIYIFFINFLFSTGPIFGLVINSINPLFPIISLYEHLTLFPYILAGFMISHGASFYYEFLKNKMYKKENYAPFLMFQPYKRVFITHLTILFGGALFVFFSLLAPFLIVFTAFKIIAELTDYKFKNQPTSKA